MPVDSSGKGYTGSRFFKCDLQMQTPADSSHWCGLAMGDTDPEMDQAAEEYIRRCYEVGLEVIAITDHNFASKRFMPHLGAAIDRLCGEFGYRITLFPGFEINADVGKGCHVLALFEPGTDLETIDHILTECGIPLPRFVSGQAVHSRKRLPEILDIVQLKARDGGIRGIVILPHALSDCGIFDRDKIAEWLQPLEFVNPDLLCIEVPKPPRNMSAGFRKLLGNGPDCDPTWKRARPIGCIMSSDCKALRREDGPDNYIGSRYSWIKMSSPSIESLRQAFLDPDSRIRLQDARPEDSYEYSKITKLKWSGVTFLKDGELCLSDNMTAIIGGRGTGKSTLVEYLRLALGQEASVKGKSSRDNLQGITATITPETLLRISVEKERQVLTIEKTATSAATVIEGPVVPEISLFFPTRVLSQGEIKAVSDDPQAQLRLIDDVIRAPLGDLERRAEDVIQKIRGLQHQIASLSDLKARERTLETERQDLEIRLSRLKELEAPLARWKGYLSESEFFRRLTDESHFLALRIRETVEQQEFQSTVIGSELESAPTAALTTDVAGLADALLEGLKRDVFAAIGTFSKGVDDILDSPGVAKWREDFTAARSDFEDLRTELAKQGTDPDQYLTYQRNLREKEVELAELRKRIAGISDLERQCYGDSESGVPGLMSDLHALWSAQTELRRDAAGSLQEGVSLTAVGQPFVKLSVAGQSDGEAFLSRLRDEPRDRRRLSDEDLNEILQQVLRVSAASQESPCHVLRLWIGQLRGGVKPVECPWQPTDRRVIALLAIMTPAKIAELCLWRTPDRIHIELYRNDGSLVGELSQRKLSVGQRCTVILALLLAHDTVPIIIDQPEEDLDNEFVFQELVPLLRKVKEKRQVILVTHNANIPVNGDAELVVALEVKDGRGLIKEISGRKACGGLDQTSVKLAVEDIMEGSEEAFRRRFEKYGF